MPRFQDSSSQSPSSGINQIGFADFARDYQTRFQSAVDGWDLKALCRIMKVLQDARDHGHHVLCMGNGGSAAIGNHLECDASKGTFHHGGRPLMSRSLAANPSLLTALGNDIGFESIFDKQLDYYARPGDVVVIISASGNSPNVVNACYRAKELGLVTVAMVGFDGGKLKRIADHVLHVPVDNCGMVEDLHQASMHLITQYLNRAWSPPEAGPPDSGV